MPMKREHQFNFWYAVLAVLAVLTIRDLLTNADGCGRSPYSEFQQLTAQGRVSDLVVGKSRITGVLRDAPDSRPQRFTTVRVEPALAASLAGSGVSFAG